MPSGRRGRIANVGKSHLEDLLICVFCKYFAGEYRSSNYTQNETKVIQMVYITSCCGSPLILTICREYNVKGGICRGGCCHATIIVVAMMIIKIIADRRIFTTMALSSLN